MDDLTLELLSSLDQESWNNTVAGLCNSHVLQSYQWGEVKARVGWKDHYLVWKDQEGNVKAAALVLSKAIPVISKIAQSCIIYVPRGPVLDWRDAKLVDTVLRNLINFGRKNRAIFIKIDPDIAAGYGLPQSPSFEPDTTGQSIIQKLTDGSWFFSDDQIQFRNTVLLDLTLSEEEMLGAMKQKTRYNILLAERKGVSIRKGSEEDFPGLYRMYAQTALRDGFAIRDEAYYIEVWRTLFRAGMAIPLIAEVDGKSVSAMILFVFAQRAYYFYGMSTGDHREKMPNHLLQWEAIKTSRSIGCRVYDFWGAPDTNDERDPLWGVYRFKDGFNGRVVSGIGAWDYILNPILFKTYNNVVPAILDVMRKIGRKRITREVNG